MGFARLSYSRDGSVRSTTVLHDIVGVVTGNFTSVTQLTGAVQNLSEIVNTDNSNWNILFPAPENFVAATPNVNIASWVLTAPCVNSSKTKFVRLTNVNLTTINIAGAVAGNVYGPSKSLGITQQSATGATSATSLSNETWYGAGSGTGRQATINGSDIYLSWSRYHLLIFGDLDTEPTLTTLGILASMEFSETSVTIASNTLPVIQLIEKSSLLSALSTVTGPSSLSSGSIGFAIFPQFYNIQTGTTAMANLAGLMTSVSSSLDQRFSTLVGNQLLPTTLTRDRNNNSRILLMPLIVNLLSIGHTPMYLSKLTNIYLVQPGLGSPGETVTVNSDTYVYLPTGAPSNLTNYAFLVKKS
jgi:hypothetical protein